MRYIATLLVTLAGFSWPALALNCPDNSAEFMRHLGRSLMPADRLASNPSSPTDANIQAAIDGIDNAIRCSQFTMCEDGLALLPERLRSAPDAYRGYMAEFITLLESYRAQFEKQLAVKEDERKFEEAYDVKRAIQAVVGRSHHSLKDQ